MKAIIDKLNPGSIIQVPNAESIVIIEVQKIGICISVLHRNMMTWIELNPFLEALGYDELAQILGKSILISPDISKNYHPLSKDIE